MIALIWYYYRTDEFNNANDDVIDYPRNYSIIKNFEKITSNVMDMPSTDKFLKIHHLKLLYIKTLYYLNYKHC